MPLIAFILLDKTAVTICIPRLMDAYYALHYIRKTKILKAVVQWADEDEDGFCIRAAGEMENVTRQVYAPN